jgi:hypothetical protein
VQRHQVIDRTAATLTAMRAVLKEPPTQSPVAEADAVPAPARMSRGRLHGSRSATVCSATKSSTSPSRMPCSRSRPLNPRRAEAETATSTAGSGVCSGPRKLDQSSRPAAPAKSAGGTSLLTGCTLQMIATTSSACERTTFYYYYTEPTTGWEVTAPASHRATLGALRGPF